MPLRSDWSDDGCPIARAIEAVGDPWVLLILREALTGARHFDEFKRRLGVADNILSARLRRMVDLGLLAHSLDPDSPRRTGRHYVLTAAGEDVLPILHALSRWGETHTPTPGPRRRLGVICRACGNTTVPGEICESCQKPLTADHVTWVRPGIWHGRRVDLVPADSSSAA